MADFDRMLAEQGGRCAICGTEEPGSRQWNVDHCHETGRVRGLLCTACNTGIGHLRDDPGILLSAMTYLNDGQPVITLADRRAIRQLLARGRSLLESA